MENDIANTDRLFTTGRWTAVSDEHVDISIVICTRNRCVQLSKALATISRLSFTGAWQIVVVDNGSTDATAQVVREAQRLTPVEMKYVYAPKPGLGAARNIGINASRGDIIVFTDDDCYPDENYLQEVLPIFRDPTLGFATGRVLLHDETDAPVTINPSETPLRFPPRTFIPSAAIIGANLAFRRSALDQIGGFDAMMGSGTPFPAEDVDAAARASRAGWAGTYCPNLVVSHHHGRKAGPDIARLYRQYDIGRGAYHVKLLLHGDVMSFLRGIYGLRWRWPHNFATPFREFYGSILYCVYAVTKR